MNKIVKWGIALCFVVQIIACMVLMFKDHIIPIHSNLYGEFDPDTSASDIMILPLMYLIPVLVYAYTVRHPQSINLPPNVPDKDRAIALSVKFLGYVTLWGGLLTTYLTLSAMFSWPIGIGTLILILILIALIINVVKQIYKKEA